MNYLNKSGGNLDNREYLRKKAYDGLRRRGCIQSSNYDKDKDYIQRLEDELNIIFRYVRNKGYKIVKLEKIL